MAARKREAPRESTSEIIDEIRVLQRHVADNTAMRHTLEAKLRTTRALLYVILALNLALFGFLLGALFKYIT